MRKVLFVLIFTALMACKNHKTSISESVEIKVPNISYSFKTLDNAELFAGRLERLDSFPSKHIKTRPVDVWLPKNYSDQKKYSVLYMHDGQMLFDSTATWNKQEWKVDEWATQLVDEGKVNDFIVVGIHNIPELRWQDLFPQKVFKNIDESEQVELLAEAMRAKIYAEFSGDNYLKFIVEELKPIIDSTFSVHTNKENTFVMGSSMGGLMAMYAICEYPEIFGGAAGLSTHWPGAMPMPNNPYPVAIFEYMKDNLPNPKTHKLYFDYGNKTLDAHYPQHAQDVDEVLEAAGYTSENSKNLFFEGTDHSERSWNKRLDQPLTFLLAN